MKILKQPAILWCVAGLILSLCTIGAAIYGINSSTAVLMDTSVVTAAAEEVLDCARTGDYEALGQLLYGAPDLGAVPEKEDTAESLIWYAFLDSIQYQPDAVCQADGACVTLDVSVTCLDISAVTASLQAIAPERMKQMAEEMDSNNDIYDEEHNFREEFVAEVLRSSTVQVLAEQPQTMERRITLQFIESDGRWQVVPTEALLQLLSGFVSE